MVSLRCSEKTSDLTLSFLAVQTYFFLYYFHPLQVKRPLRPQRQRLPLNLEASRTTARPGRSTTGSRPLTTARPTHSQWARRHKLPRYTRPDNNALSTFTYTQSFCTVTRFTPQVFTGLRWPQQPHTLNQNHLPSYTGFLAFYFGKLSPLFLLLTCNVSSMYFFCTGPVMWSGHKVNATLSKQNPLLNVWMQTPWWRS